MSCYSRPPIWSLGDVRTFSLPNQWAVCVCLPHAGGLRGAVRQTEGLGLQLLVALHQDGLRHGRSRGGQPHHWSVPCTEVKRPPTSSSFFSPCLLFPILFCLAPLFSPSKDSPDPLWEKPADFSFPNRTLFKGPLPSLGPPCQNRGESKNRRSKVMIGEEESWTEVWSQWWSEERGFIFVVFLFFPCLPLS